MKYIATLSLPLLFISCKSTSVVNIGIIGFIAIFGTMFLLFALMFFLIAKRKKQGEKSLVKFNNDIYFALNRLDTPQGKANMLSTLIGRINNDEKYKKDTEWRDKVLLKAYTHLATVYYHMGDEMQTLNACSEIIKLDSKDGMAYYNRGSIYSNMGLYEKALQDLNKTIELMPGYAGAYNNRGLVRKKTEHYGEALDDFSKAVELEGSPIAYYNRGNTYYELKEYDKALDDYNHIIRNMENYQPDFKKEVEQSIRIVEDRKSNLK
ncbi:MAG: tetratricopeptide repeat protein [Prevotella sp.]|jgi:tetratricopeptide (TPR) repeat protein|nr:tetratricopeptide repeat protein [Prevotella sp.]